MKVWKGLILAMAYKQGEFEACVCYQRYMYMYVHVLSIN